MREQARYTPDDNNVRKCQMDPENMIEQLTACSDWWDKYAKTLTGQGKRKEAHEAPFMPFGKKLKGGGGSGGRGAGASGSGYDNGGGSRHDRKAEGRKPDNRGAGSNAGAPSGNAPLISTTTAPLQEASTTRSPTPLRWVDGKPGAPTLTSTHSGCWTATGLKGCS
jgi:hypothetical protein